MTYKTALRTRIVAAGIADARVQWGRLPPETALPYIRLAAISDPRPETLDGYQSARVTRVQADCFGATYEEADTLAEALIAALDTPATLGGVRFGRSKAEGPRDLSEELPGGGILHRASVDLLIEHALA